MDSPGKSVGGASGDSQDPHEGPDFSSRAILSLAIPALGALIVEPLLLTIDSVMVGSLGTASLAGLSLASTILTTLVGLFVFLAYATTALTAHAVGRGKPGEGVQAGVDAMWLAFAIGLCITTVLILGAPSIVQWMGAEPSVAIQATAYLRGGAPGMTAMLVILAATGTLRGVLDMKTPLYVVSAGAAVNVVMNLILIFGLGWGILGAGVGLSITQTLMATALVMVVVRKGRSLGISFRPSFAGLGGAFGTGLPLFVRTVSLRLALLFTVGIATQAGVVALAAYQVVSSIWVMAAFALDALAIAAQSLVGVALGSGQRDVLRALVRKMTLWGASAAGVIGGIIAVASPWLPLMFGSDPDMRSAASAALIAAGLLMPIGGVVFILDGVLIGAGEGRYLAWIGMATLALYLPALWWLHTMIATFIRTEVGQPAPSHPYLTAPEQTHILVLLWVAFAGWFMLLRAVTNGMRAFSPKLGYSSAERVL